MGRHLAATTAAILLLIFGLAGLRPAAANPAPFNTRLAILALHDVRDDASALDDAGVTSDRLVQYLDWLRGDGWTAVSLDDVERARRGERPLPPKAVMLTVDDGYRSLYTRVYPLALAYGMPLVASLPTAAMEGAHGTSVRFGRDTSPRDRFITWEQAREMQASGLVEFALHSHALHDETLANPQGNTMPLASTRRFDPRIGYETEAAFASRLGADLAEGRAVMTRRLGRAPRAMAWPYGRYNATAVQAARTAGFTLLLALDGAVADARRPEALSRHLVSREARLGDLAVALDPDTEGPRVERLTCLNPAALWSGNAARDDERLGHVIERVRALGLTGVVVEATRRGADGRPEAAWFPTRELPLAGDVLSRLAWQLWTRGGVAVYARLPHRRALEALDGDPVRVRRLFDDLGAMVPIGGWLMEDTTPPQAFPHASAQAPRAGLAWEDEVIRERRQGSIGPLQTEGPDALAWQLFASLERARPELRLLAFAPAGARPAVPHPLAELTLVPLPLGGDAAPVALPSALTRWYVAATPPDAATLAGASLRQQRHGGISFGWCPDDALGDHPPAAGVAPAVSGATSPARR